MWWLKQQGASVRPELVARKIADYRIDGYPALLDSLLERAPSIIAGRAFQDEMKRFVQLMPS
ncbi:hypothetical protein [Candidatus Rariloculus sp.]|uniref:hypothetical protein n=1 Tax=Candidatus Rariloculus sp. TaxID=3101265 RepID=UPI003D11A7B6